MMEVTKRRLNEERKFQYQQSVFLAHWIYTAIPKGTDSEYITMDKFMEMYGVGNKKVNEDKPILDREVRKKQALLDAYRNVEGLGIPIPDALKE